MNVSPSRWNEIESLFAAAVQLPAERRNEFIASAFTSDAMLRDELRSLLAAHEQLGGKLDEPDGAFLARLDAERAVSLMDAMHAGEHWEGRTLGPYRILREAGRGGMGTVYLAERADDQYRKQVAIKVVRQGLVADESVRRFREERQILASLDHPNIARLFDGGVSADGLPYLVMEYVEGTPIDRYAKEHQLGVDARLALFIQICQAVQFAHAKLVVHRDLKPSNILVTAAGEVKLLDFGVAKLLTAEREAGVTRTGTRPMTPAYASPEQVRGEPVSTASDVYTLGVLLYELLAEVHPFHGSLDGSSIRELERLILEQEPERPSVVAEASRRRRLRGDLDTIVLTAMRKEPERRYATAEQFVADVRRYLAGRPVAARSDTWLYRTQKLVRRHPAGAVVAGAFVAVLVGFSAVANAAARRAEREGAKASQTAALLNELFTVSAPGAARGEIITAREVLDRGAARVERELADQPEVRAEMLAAIGRAYFGLGLYDQSKPLLEGALALRRRMYGDRNADVATSLWDLASLLRNQGQFDKAEPMYREALTIRRALFGDKHPKVVESLNGLAFLLRGRGDFAASEAMYREAIGISREVFQRPHPYLAVGLQGLATALWEGGKHKEAEPLYREAVALDLQLFGRDDPETIITRYNQARNYQYLGDFPAAEPIFAEILEQDPRVYGANHPLVAMRLSGYGEFLLEQGGVTGAARADSVLRRALAIQRKALPPGSERTAGTLIVLGRALMAAGRHQEAEPLVREGLEIREKRMVASSWRIAEARSVLGTCLSMLARPTEAEPLLLRGYASLQTQRPAGDAALRRAREALIAHYERTGQDSLAARHRAQRPPTTE